MDNCITLSKELLHHEIFMRPERLRFFLWLLPRAGADGLVSISPKEARMALGVSPKQYRLWLDYMCATGLMAKVSVQSGERRNGMTFEVNTEYLPTKSRVNPDSGNVSDRRIAAPSKEKRVAAADDLDFGMFMDFFNRQVRGTAIQPIRLMTPKRKTMIKARLAEYGKGMLAKAVTMAVQSDFLSGRSGKWCAGFDWIFKASNFIKIIEGNYNGQGIDDSNNKSACKAEVGTNGIGKVASAILQRLASDKAG